MKAMGQILYFLTIKRVFFQLEDRLTKRPQGIIEASRIVLQKAYNLTTVHFRDKIIVSILIDTLLGPLAGRQMFHVFQKIVSQLQIFLVVL